MPSTSSSSQTQRSLCDSISTIRTRASSASAWNQRAIWAAFGRAGAVVVTTLTDQVFLIRQGPAHQAHERLRRQPLRPDRGVDPQLRDLGSREPGHGVLELLAAFTEASRHERPKRGAFVTRDQGRRERRQPPHRAANLRRRAERSRRDREELLHPAHRLHAHRQRAIRLASGLRGQPLRHFGLHEKDHALGQGRRQRFLDQWGRDVVRDIADDLRDARPLCLQGIALNHAQPLTLELGREPAVLFDRDDLGAALEQRRGETALPRPDLQHRLAGLDFDGVGDTTKNARIGEKMLAESSQNLSSTSVRSSFAGAPPVNAAMSVKTASRMCRAGRARRLVTWLSTRGSPNRSPLGPRASASPSVKRQRMALPRSNRSTRSCPPFPSPSGGRVASSRLTEPSAMETRKACGCPAFAYVSVPFAGSTTAEQSVKNISVSASSSAREISSRRSASCGDSAVSAWIPEAAIASAMISAAPNPWLETSPTMTPTRSPWRLNRL